MRLGKTQVGVLARLVELGSCAMSSTFDARWELQALWRLANRDLVKHVEYRHGAITFSFREAAVTTRDLRLIKRRVRFNPRSYVFWLITPAARRALRAAQQRGGEKNG